MPADWRPVPVAALRPTTTPHMVHLGLAISARWRHGRVPEPASQQQRRREHARTAVQGTHEHRRRRRLIDVARNSALAMACRSLRPKGAKGSQTHMPFVRDWLRTHRSGDAETLISAMDNTWTRRPSRGSGNSARARVTWWTRCYGRSTCSAFVLARGAARHRNRGRRCRCVGGRSLARALTNPTAVDSSVT